MGTNNIENPSTNDGWSLAFVSEKGNNKGFLCLTKLIDGKYKFKNLKKEAQEKIKKDGGILTFPYNEVNGENNIKMRIYGTYEIKTYLEIQRKDSNE